MAMKDMLIPEFDQEMATTRHLLERVPVADATWRPHPKSATLGNLAVHVANLAAWPAMTLTAPELDLAVAPTPSPFTTVEALLAVFDANVKASHAALTGALDADFSAPWSLRNGPRVILTLPRSVVVRSFAFSHLIHHRAQLGVYLRLRDVPLPPCYGPTADTGM